MTSRAFLEMPHCGSSTTSSRELGWQRSAVSLPLLCDIFVVAVKWDHCNGDHIAPYLFKLLLIIASETRVWVVATLDVGNMGELLESI